MGILKIPHTPVGFPRASEASNWPLCKLTRYREEARGSIKQSGGFNPEPCSGAAGWLWGMGERIPTLASGKPILKIPYLRTRSTEVCGARCPLTKPQSEKKEKSREVGNAAKAISVDATGGAAFTTTGRRFRIEGREEV